MKRICVIGAGASGLPAIKCCLDEKLIPLCYEKSHDIGGLWRYKENSTEEASIYKSVVINTSKEMMCYSDFPIPKEFANFMHHSKILEYFRLYAKQFNLLQHIKFDTEVLKCEPHKDYENTGRWIVTIKNRQDGETSTEIFDGILVCIGHHAIPHYPCESFPGFEKFKGTTMHSHSYKEPYAFRDKKVVVIGMGNSGGDIAVELGRNAKQVFLSTRRGSWVWNRMGQNGIPKDILFLKRSSKLVANFLPKSWIISAVEKDLKKELDHSLYRLKPKHSPLSQHPLVSNGLPNSILSGLVVIKSNVKEFTENGIIFEDGTFEEVDAAIFATGYKFNFPFLDDSIVKVRNNECRLYRHMWPPQLQRGSLAVIGKIQPLGAINPISEMQCRWATRVLKGDVSLPPRRVMENSIDEAMKALKKGFYHSARHTMEVDYMDTMDELADEIGVKPQLFKLFKEDFRLGLKVLFGPCTPYQYRLTGPGRWSDARQTIMTQDERISYPFTTRKVEVDEKRLGWLFYLFIAFFVVLVAYLIY